jgi:hypothetical protein
VNLTVRLEDGFRFPRKLEQSMQAGVEETVAGPIPLPSPIKEDTKFMDVWKLKRLFANPSGSQRLHEEVVELIRQDQSKAFLDLTRSQLNGPDAETVFNFEGGERYILQRAPEAPKAVNSGPSEISVKPLAAGGERLVVFRKETPGQPPSIVHAAELHFHAEPSSKDDGSMDCSMSLLDCTTETEQGPPAPRANFSQRFTAPMPEKVAAISGRGLAYYSNQPQSLVLRHDELRLLNQIIAECHNRASFAISCLILVMVGSSLGMIFRSGNFLNAFAVSFIPALLSITLTIAGQRTAANFPYKANASDPLMLGLALIWMGNLINLVLAAGLLLRLHRK